MRAKTVVAFWASVAAAVFLLGGSVASVEAFVRHPSVTTGVVLALSLLGLVFAAIVAGRILFVLGRAQRKPRVGDA
jgi:hypothetical protein